MSKSGYYWFRPKHEGAEDVILKRTDAGFWLIAGHWNPVGDDKLADLGHVLHDEPLVWEIGA